MDLTRENLQKTCKLKIDTCNLDFGDSAESEDGTWVTMSGAPVLLDKEGNVLGGMGGKYKTTSELKGLGPIDHGMSARMRQDRINRETEKRKAGEAWREQFMQKHMEKNAPAKLPAAPTPQSESSTTTAPAPAPKAISPDLIRQANATSFVFEQGESVAREYAEDLKAIDALNIPDTDKASAKDRIHALAEKELRELSQAPSSAVAGPGGYSRIAGSVNKHREAAMSARSERLTVLRNLRQQSSSATTKQNAADFQAGFLAARGAADDAGSKTFSYAGMDFKKRGDKWTNVRKKASP